MNILLTVPFFPFRESHPLIPDLGLGYLASALRKKGFHVSVNDWNARQSPEQLAAFLKNVNPQIVGLKFFTLNVAAAKKTIHLIHSILGEDIPVILGGPHPCAEEKKWLHHDFPKALARFVGESEVSFPTWCSLLAEGKKVSEIPAIEGIEFLDDTESPQPTPTIIDNLDSLEPPAWDLIAPERYPAFSIDREERILAPIMTTRGCPAPCQFCCISHISGRTIRRHSVEYIIEQMLLLNRDHKVTAFSFLDTNFMTDVDWLDLFLEKLDKTDLNVIWNCVWGLSPRKYSKEILKKMAAQGCHAIIMGIESGDDKIRSENGKNESASQIEENVVRIRQAGIQVHGFFMIGFPGETRAQMDKTISMSRSLPLEVMSLSILYPLPGTEHYAWLKKKYSIEHIDWEHFSVYSSPYPMSTLSSRQLSRLRRVEQIRNMLKPGRLYADFKRGFITKEVLLQKLKKVLVPGK